MNFKLILIGLLLVLFSTPIFALSDTDLVAYYNFDETSGTTLIDVKGYDQNGVNTNATINQTGKIGKDYNFNGTTSFVTLPNNLIVDNNFSWSFWFRPQAQINNPGFVLARSKGGIDSTSYLFQYYNNTIEFVMYNTAGVGKVIGKSGIVPGYWYHVVGVFNKSMGKLELYIDGNKENEIAGWSGNVYTGNTNTFFAQDERGVTYRYKGEIDEVGYWEKALSQTEITELYNSGNGLTYPFDINRIYADFDYSINNLQVDLNDTSTIIGDAVIDSWEWLVDGVSVSTDQNYSFTGTESTDYNVCLLIEDTVLSLNDSICQTVSIGDITPPTTTFSSNQVPNTTDQNITLTCTDNNSGCKAINYNINNEGWNEINDINYISSISANQTVQTDPAVKLTQIDLNYSGNYNPLYQTFYQSKITINLVNHIGYAWGFIRYIYDDDSYQDTSEVVNTGPQGNITINDLTLPTSLSTKLVKRIELWGRQGGTGKTIYTYDFIYSLNTDRNNINFLYSGAGDHNIQYFSTDNSDNNETIKTSYFTTYGAGKFTFYDENSLNLLNSINYTITPSINGVSSGTTDGNTLDLNLQGITTGTYTFTFTKSGYPTRYYQIDLNQYSEIDINFALIPESLSKEIQFRFYKPDQTTSYNNVYITASKNPQGFVLSRLKTDATGLVTFNLDQNSTGITFDMNNGENTYNSVILTINKPKDEQTLIDINANWSYNISGLASYTDSNATTATKVFAIYSNTVNTYSVLIGSTSTVPTYTTRKYDIQVFGDTNTYTLQPYLINTTDSIQTTIFTINPYTNQAISDVTIKIYRTLPLTGRTLIEQTITDSKGQSIVYLVLNQTYSFEISVGTTTIRTETYTITGTSSTIYFKVDPGYDLSTTPMQTSIYSFWTPGKSSLNKADRNISANVIYGTNKNSVTVSSIILNCYNNLDLNQVLLFQDSFSSPTMNFIQTYDFNLTTKTLNSVTFDTNYSITCNIYTTLSDGNLIVSRQTYTMNNDDPQTNLGMDLRPFFGCSSTTDPNLPCPSMILAAVFITMMVITGIMIESGFTQPEFAGILFLIGLGFFTFFTWIPPVLYVIMLVIGLLIYVALGVRRI